MSRAIAFTMLTTVLFACAAPAQPPVGAPAGTTATCKDGTFSSSANKQGACSSHKGIKEWYGAAIKVWANKDTQTYHCPSDKWYGKTQNGTYMSESDAKAQGYHADHDKGCQ
jgi:hypothetical protein